MKSKRNCEGYTPRVIFKDPLGAYRPSQNASDTLALAVSPMEKQAVNEYRSRFASPQISSYRDLPTQKSLVQQHLQSSIIYMEEETRIAAAATKSSDSFSSSHSIQQSSPLGNEKTSFVSGRLESSKEQRAGRWHPARNPHTFASMLRYLRLQTQHLESSEQVMRLKRLTWQCVFTLANVIHSETPPAAGQTRIRWTCVSA